MSQSSFFSAFVLSLIVSTTAGAVTSLGTASSSSRELAAMEACSRAMQNQYVCESGQQFIIEQSELTKCLEKAHCINLREPNIPYSEDDFVCSGNISGRCEKSTSHSSTMIAPREPVKIPKTSDIVTDGIIAKRVYNVNALMDHSKVVEGRVPTVRVKGVRMTPDCNGPRSEVTGYSELDAEKSRFVPHHRISVSYAATRMGCGQTDYSDANLKTFMFDEPIRLPVKEGRAYIILSTEDRLIRSLILDFEY